MLESKILSMKDRLWPAGIAALAMHSAVIAAMALGIAGPQGTAPQNFHVEVMFRSESDTKTREAQSDSREGGHETSILATQKTTMLEDYSLKEVAKVSQTKKPSMQSAKKPTSETSHLKNFPVRRGQSSGDASDAFPIYNPPPIYPYEAKQKRIQGVVMIRLSLTDKGIVHKATTLSPHIDPILEDAALKATHQWRFKPGVRIVEVPIEFKLEI